MKRKPRPVDGVIQLSLLPYDVSDIHTFGDYRIVDTEEALEELLIYLAGAEYLAVDTETTGTDAMKAKLVGISLAREPGRAFYLPTGHSTVLGLGRQLPLEQVQARLGPVFVDSSVNKVGHNLKYDIEVLERHGLPLEGPLSDSMIAAWMLDPASHHLGLKAQVQQRLGLEMTPIEALIGQGYSLDLVSTARVGRYSCADADMTLRLMEVLRPAVQTQHEWLLFSKMEMPLIPVLVRMETHGVMLDEAYLGAMGAEMEQQLEELTGQIHSQAGHKFNVNSPEQLATVLFTELRLPQIKETSTDISVLNALESKHPIVGPLLEHRQLTKLKGTYIDALPKLMDSTGRIHASFNQVGTSTGRLSSSHPNLQQVPVRTELGRKIRGAFVAPEGYVLLSCDYTQIEPRILAHVTQDPKLLEAFATGVDVHTSTASELFNVPLKEVTYDQRTLAKRIYFGLMYGISDRGLSERTGLTVPESKAFIEAYFARFTKVRGYFDATVKRAQEVGNVRTLLGRKRFFPELLASSEAPLALRRSLERAAINMPIQGTAADIMKLAMIAVDRELRSQGLNAHLVLQIHDELVLEVPMAEVEATQVLVTKAMEEAFRLDAPLRAHSAVGHSWLEAM